MEWPVTVTCSFDETLLDLPPRLLVESMRVHQRVFPLWRSEDQLDHHFLAVTNNPFATDAETARIIAAGNAKVIGARFHDARFFYADDRRKTLEEHGAALASMRWIRGGGTMADKQRRVADLAASLAPRFGADPDLAGRAGALCKADLATQMVGEFPELQGHVGRLLAELGGEPGDVPLAIEEHYLPRFSGDALPTTATGRVVAIADRLDTLAGCFACGIRVKGSNDPLALRRAAIGLLQLLLMGGERIDLGELLAEALTRAPHPEGSDLDAVARDLEAFVMARFTAWLKERHDTEVVEAVLAGSGDRDPVALRARVEALSALAATPAFGPIKATFKRALGLVKDHPDPTCDVAAFSADAERALHRALLDLGPRAEAAEAALDYPAALALLSELKAPVDRLFDEVMVMAEDPAVRANRLGLLRSVCEAFRRVADLSVMSAE
ncbi:MAG: glycine--tRNA ligase subunit beta [Deltaproteobacteria bacterium]|nr:MAG: glycine--tRNA ligase subunit beta [Deltaproteobacteria bacterium]